MAVKTFTTGEVLTASDTNTYLNNGGLVYLSEQTVTSGSLCLFSACFSATYTAYRITLDSFQPASINTSLNLQLRSGASPANTADYYFAYSGLYVNGTNAASTGSATTSIETGIYNSANSIQIGSAVIDIFNPFVTQRTFFNVQASLYNTQFGARHGIAEHNLTTSYDSFQVFPASGNFTNLRVRLYGYRQA